MTPLQGTNVMGDREQQLTSDAQKTEAQDFFTKNFKVNESDQAVVLEVMNKKIQATPGFESVTLSPADLLKILKGETTGDTQKDKIKVNRYVYLLAECGNESI